MDEKNKFGIPKVTQFGDTPAANDPGDSTHCSQCEAMLADALDGVLSPEDQTLFDLHMTRCGPCADLLADARRGAAWLEMLKSPQPEPPAALLDKILAQTSGAAVEVPGFAPPAGAYDGIAVRPAMAPGYVVPAYVHSTAFRGKLAAFLHRSPLGQVILQPRLAMTVAMAFFSIVLTMDLTGIRVQDLRPGNLRPASLKREFYSANARVARYYEGLRVVYELESRVRDLQTTDSDIPGSAPQTKPQTVEPAQRDQTPPDQQPEPKQQEKQAAPKSGTSHRESAARPQFASNGERPSAPLLNDFRAAEAFISEGHQGRLV